MKKLLFLFTALLFISCSSDENEESTQTFLEKYDGYFFIQESQVEGVSDDGYYFSNSEIYQNYVILNDGCNECYLVKDIKDQELKCPDHDLFLQQPNEIAYCKVVENSSSKFIDECVNCNSDGSIMVINTYEFTVVEDELRVTNITKNSDGVIEGTKLDIYRKTSQSFSCECNE